MSKTASPNGTHVIEFGGETIPFVLERRQRRRLSISVHPDRRVTVLAPADCNLADVLARVQKRAAWITKQRAYFAVDAARSRSAVMTWALKATVSGFCAIAGAERSAAAISVLIVMTLRILQ